MPFQDPQLLEPDFPRGPIQEKAVHESIVPVEADMPHVITLPLLTIKRWRRVGILWPEIIPLSAQEQWYISP